ncbi:YolD-like family protein [Sporolactobacillus sp. THM7-4]|nr:YolD-like family protein [Sporolactobacillus sp. THM7-4]
MRISKLTPGWNLRWESSRMMLPEHVRALNEHKSSMKKIDRPQLDEQEWEEIGRIVHEAVIENKPADVKYYKDGKIKTMTGYCLKPDPVRRYLKFSDRFGISWEIAFRDIVDVQLTGTHTDPFSEE